MAAKAFIALKREVLNSMAMLWKVFFPISPVNLSLQSAWWSERMCINKARRRACAADCSMWSWQVGWMGVRDTV